ALRGLARLWLAESDERRRAWRDRIVQAVAPNARLLTDLCPELQQILGPQPPVPELPRTEAQNRFQLAIVDFVRAVAAGQPLVVFIDDLQFADASTLNLIGWLATARALPRLLLIG